jgi:hypothetical protein
MPITVREYSMKPHLELEIIQWMQPLLVVGFRELKIDLVLSGIFRIFV